ASVRCSGSERGLAGLIPEGNARIIVLAFVPTGALEGRIFVRGNPAEMLEGYFDAGIEHDRIIDVPAIRARMGADDSPLIEIGNTEIGGAGRFQTPGGKKIILCAGAPN